MKRRATIHRHEVHVNRNRSVFVKLTLPPGGAAAVVDVAVPDREQVGFYLRHLKGLTVEEAVCLHKALGEALGHDLNGSE